MHQNKPTTLNELKITLAQVDTNVPNGPENRLIRIKRAKLLILYHNAYMIYNTSLSRPNLAKALDFNLTTDSYYLLQMIAQGKTT